MKLLTVLGARPQFIKAATLSRAIARHNAARPAESIDETIVHTGQHYDDNMSDVFFRELDIPTPAVHLGVGSASHGVQTGRMIERLEEVLVAQRPDALLVFGDTNSTLAGALAAAKLNVPVAHVEAGLRSFNKRMAEEVNRIVCDHLAARLYCPTRAAIENLRREGITEGVEDVGDVMYDGMLHYRGRAGRAVLEAAEVEPGKYVFATVHRAENTDDPARLKAIVQSLADAATRIGAVVLALHPRTRRIVDERGIAFLGPIKVIEPASYLESIALMANAAAILTDSGGMQKEAFFLEVPCLTLREETEWVETVECGANRLVGADPVRVLAALDELIAGRWKPDFSARPYGTGHAADAIARSLATRFPLSA